MFPTEQVLKMLKTGIDPAVVNAEQRDKLVNYLELLSKWTKVHNLTAVRDPLEMVSKHLLDSLSVLPFLAGGSVIDVGTGAGLPGTPLGIVRSDIRFVLLDSNAKKINFLTHVISTLKLKNIKVIHSRVQDYHELFDVVISRAYSSLSNFVETSGHLAKPTGTWIAMKGLLSASEISEIAEPYKIEKIEPVSVPNVNEKRCLVFIKKEIT